MHNPELISAAPTFHGLTAEEWLDMEHEDSDAARSIWTGLEEERLKDLGEINNFDPVTVYLEYLRKGLEQRHGVNSQQASHIRKFEQFLRQTSILGLDGVRLAIETSEPSGEVSSLPGEIPNNGFMVIEGSVSAQVNSVPLPLGVA